jgi:hypothetical protein
MLEAKNNPLNFIVGILRFLNKEYIIENAYF